LIKESTFDRTVVGPNLLSSNQTVATGQKQVRQSRAAAANFDDLGLSYSSTQNYLQHLNNTVGSATVSNSVFISDPPMFNAAVRNRVDTLLSQGNPHIRDIKN
jgi:hypothetical protein